MIYRRGEGGDFARFLRIARGSGCGLEAQVSVAARVGLVDGEAARAPPERIEKLEASNTDARKTDISPLNRIRTT
jgi:hypothetical protein